MKEEIISLITKGDHEIALKQLLSTIHKKSKYRNELIILSNQLSIWNTEKRTGLNPNNYDLNRITNSILKVTNLHFDDPSLTIDSIWNVSSLEKELNTSIQKNSKEELIEILKSNSFLFYFIYFRKYGINPPFYDVKIGDYTFDFCWLNDNSDGPEWVLILILPPGINVLGLNNKPSKELEENIEYINSAMNFIESYKGKVKDVFVATYKFRYVLVGGSSDFWQIDKNASWRQKFNNKSKIELRSQGVFKKSIALYKNYSSEYWSFEENPVSRDFSKLKEFYFEDGYLERWKRI